MKKKKHLRIDRLFRDELVFIICHKGINMYYRCPQLHMILINLDKEKNK